MEILNVIPFPPSTVCPRISSKKILPCPYRVLKPRCSAQIHGTGKTLQRQVTVAEYYVLDKGTTSFGGEEFGRRKMLLFPVVGLGTEILKDNPAMAADFADMPALRGKDYGKTKMRYPDFMETESGLQYKDLRIGNGPSPKMGDMVVVDWDGYTIGYYGRIFEARNKSKGGSFEGGEKDYFKFRFGANQVIPAFEEAIASMGVGGVRRIIVPPNLGYPDNDFNNKGPKPTTFSGQRALDFVLKNQGLIDKTLLFDIELLKVIPT